MTQLAREVLGEKIVVHLVVVALLFLFLFVLAVVIDIGVAHVGV